MNMNYIFGIAAAVCVVAGVAYVLRSPPNAPSLHTRTVTMASTTVTLAVAADDQSRQKGLGGRTNIGTGMFFIFDSDDLWGIWMKDMQVPLDIVWLDKNGAIITADTNVAPDTYPRVFYPTSPARYVVELPAGFLESHYIQAGDKVKL
ncbi:MAG: DUF192 domain-containing protein [Patescibacteria group bacterium]|nr:DUF192 domain-containing protein [Patescibacteria group bacterium]